MPTVTVVPLTLVAISLAVPETVKAVETADPEPLSAAGVQLEPPPPPPPVYCFILGPRHC